MRARMRRRVASWGLAMAVTVGLPSTGSLAQGQDRVLRVAPSADLTVLDPMFSAVIITRLYSLMVYETLFSWDSKLQPQPQMVERWSTAPDQLSWDFTLRPGLRFHDGAPVTSTDVSASLKRWMVRDVLGQKLATYVAGIDAVDDVNFRIRLTKPASFLPWALGSAVGQIPAIMRASDLTGDPSRPVTTAIGSGPFRFDQAARVSGSRSVFRHNPDYQPRAEPPDGLAGGKVVRVDSVEWKVMPDANTAISALQTGEVDLVEAPLLDLLPTLASNRSVTVRKINQLNNQGILRPNALLPPFNDPRARQALALMADQSDYMSAVVENPERRHRCGAYYICGGPYGQVQAPLPQPDIAKAKALLAEAGYRGEPLTVVATKELAPIGQMSEVMIDGLRRAGVMVDVVWTDWGTMIGRQQQKGPPASGGWNLQVSYSSGITASSPMTNVGTNMVCDGSNWMGWPCDKETEALRQAFVDAPDEAAKLDAVQQLQTRLEAVRPYIPLGEFDAPIAYRNSLQGVLDSPVIVYWNIEKH